MRILTITIIMALTSTLCSAEIYKWVDENGRIHFSDKPQNTEANYYIPKTGTTSFEGGNTENSKGTPTPTTSTVKTGSKKKSAEELAKIEKQQKIAREKYEAAVEESKIQRIRNSAKYKELLRKERRAIKAQQRYPNAPKNTRLTAKEAEFLSQGRDNSELLERYEKANKK